MYNNFPSITKRLFVVVFLITSTCAVDHTFNLPEGISKFFPSIYYLYENFKYFASTAYELLIIFISVIVASITSPKTGFITSAYAFTLNDISDNNESVTKIPSSISILGSIDFTYPKLLSFLSCIFF